MFKVSINQESIQRVEKNIKDAFNKVIRNQQMLNELGETIVVDIQGTNRSGKSPKGNKHPTLAESTIRNRRYLAKYNPTHPTYSEKRSNVTITGELLDSLNSKTTGPGKLQIEAEGNHSQYKGKTKSIGKEIANEKLVGYLKDKGFFIMGIREKLIPRLRRTVIAYIRRASRTLFKLENE